MTNEDTKWGFVVVVVAAARCVRLGDARSTRKTKGVNFPDYSKLRGVPLFIENNR